MKEMKTDKTFKFISILGLVFLISIVFFSNVQAKSTTLIFSTHDPETGSWGPFYKPWLAAIEKRTNGAVKIEVHWGAELVGFFESMSAVEDGSIDIAHTMPSMYTNKFPLEDIASFNSYDTHVYGRSRQAQELFDSLPEMAASFKKTKNLFRCATFPNFVATIKGVQFTKVEECKGIKILGTGKWDSKRFEALGMVPMSIMPEETFMSLQTGVMEAATFTLPALYDFGWAEVIKHLVMLNVRPAWWACVMNKDAWNSLPPEYQKIIEEESKKMPAIKDEMELTAFRDLKAKFLKDYPDAKEIQIPKKEVKRFIDADKQVWVEFEKELNSLGFDGKKIIETHLRLEKKYSSKEYDIK
jgi:TRAP-type C4-dicarboxylate transport system substrate-binding protein